MTIETIERIKPTSIIRDNRSLRLLQHNYSSFGRGLGYQLIEESEDGGGEGGETEAVVLDSITSLEALGDHVVDRAIEGPTSANGIKLWLDSEFTEFLDEDPVDSWLDKSGNGNHFTGLSESRPIFNTNVINGLPMIRFLGSQFLSGTVVAPTNQYTVFVVFIELADPITDIMAALRWGPGGTGTFWCGYLGDGKLTPASNSSVSNDISSDSNIDDGGLHYVTGVRTPTELFGYADGVLVGSSTNNMTNRGSNAVTIGGYGETLFLEGYIGEVLIYDSALSNVERQGIENYLTEKWNSIS